MNKIMLIIFLIIQFSSFAQTKMDYYAVLIVSKSDVRQEINMFFVPKFEFNGDSLRFFEKLNEHDTRIYLAKDKLIINDINTESIDDFYTDIYFKNNSKKNIFSSEFENVYFFELNICFESICLEKEPTNIPFFKLSNNVLELKYLKVNKLNVMIKTCD